MILTAQHPYCPRLVVTREIPVLPALPGRLAYSPESKNARYDPPAAPGEAWAALAGPYFPERRGGTWLLDADQLLAIVWDLDGEPIAPGRRRRRRARWVAVAERDGGIVVYRDVTEMARDHREDHANNEARKIGRVLPYVHGAKSQKRKGVA
jgi:hypothetical protein